MKKSINFREIIKKIIILIIVFILISNNMAPIVISAEVESSTIAENGLNNESETNASIHNNDEKEVLGENAEIKNDDTLDEKIESSISNTQEDKNNEIINTSLEEPKNTNTSGEETKKDQNTNTSLEKTKDAKNANTSLEESKDAKNTNTTSQETKDSKNTNTLAEEVKKDQNTANLSEENVDSENKVSNISNKETLSDNSNLDSKVNSQSSDTKIIPAKKDDIKVKTKNDNHEIREFNVEFVSGATKNEKDNLVWTPKNSTAGHEFTFRVTYALSGEQELPAESIQITIPKSILRNKEGKLDDKCIMSLPKIEEYDGTTEFAYIEKEDYIIVYNPSEVKAGINGYFEVAYATNSTTFNYKDYDETKLDTVQNGGTASDPFNAIITVKSGDDTLASISNDEKVYINTTAKIVSTQKRYPTLYRSWDSSWTKDIPKDSDDYYYLVWEIRTYIQKNSTQSYNLKLEDVVTDLTKGNDSKDYELVGYKLSGEKYYSTKNTVDNITRDEYRYDYVLTRHKKSTYKDIAYTLKNTITVTVDPVDNVDNDTKATSSNTFSWDPSFLPPTGNFNLFKYGNNNWYSRFGTYWDYANYDLDKLQKGEVNELDSFKYYTETIGYAYPWTLKEGGSSNNAEDYGKNPVTYETWDDTLYLEGDQKPMNYNDYYLDYLTYQTTYNDAKLQEGDNKFSMISPTYEDNENIIFYAKFNGKSDWVQVGTYNFKTKQITKVDKYVQEMTTSKIKFKAGVNCTGWKFSTSNKHYYTYINVTPYFVLKNSDYVKEKIANKDSIKMQNNVSTKITDYKNSIIFEKETSAMDYARVTYYDSDITKKVSSVSNNVVGKTYTVTWKVNAWEKATSKNGNSEYIRQESGKFYDLIPLGGEIDVNSIQVECEGIFLESNEYTYEVISNYKNSGRTMLVLNINEQAQFYNIYYKTVHSWESIKDYGKNVLNPVAYETGNEKIANGYADDGGNLSNVNKGLFTDLDSTTNDKKFIYTEQTYNINAVTATVSGLYKKVKNSEESEYSYNTEVEPNGNYSYKLRFQNTFINKAKNLVLFDSIENFIAQDIASKEAKTSGWRGTLRFIDLTQLETKGINAVLYVSTVKNLDLEKNNDITDKTIWQKATNYTDLSKVTAIAIDMTKDKFGNDYILDKGDSVTAVIHMRSPEKVPDEIEKNPYTYNNVYIKNTLIDELDETIDYFIHQDYTTVKYHVVADVAFHKVSSENENKGIKGITFRLYGKSKYGTEVDEYVVSDKNGLVNFKDIEAGEYIFQEYEAPPDWLEDHTEHRVEITNKREVYIDGQLVTNNNQIKVKNIRRIYTNVTFYKKDLVDKNKSLEGVKFKLEGISDYGNEVLMYVISDSDGKVIFKNVEKGTYTLIEVSTIDGYILNGKNYKVIVDENGNYDIKEPVIKNVDKSKIVENMVTKYSHTPNIEDTGIAFDNYSDYLEKTDTVTIQGAESLDVTVYYSIEKTDYDWVCVYDNTVVPSVDNYEDSISKKLGGGTKEFNDVNAEGYEKGCSIWNGTITGDTVNFFFRSDESTNYYGYYAIIKGIKKDEVKEEQKVSDYASINNKGNYYIYNEPYHSFYFTKKDSYNYEKLGGAKFKLYGSSNTGNIYNETATSVEGTGYVTFKNIESGTYILKEVETPNTDDIAYLQEKESHIIEVFEDGKVTLDDELIWPLDQTNNQPYTWYNIRNKEQITVTKKWVDNLNNEERKEPVIYISTKKPEQSYLKAYFRTANSLNSIIDYVTDSNVTEFKRDTTLSEENVQEKLGVTRLDNDYDNEDAEYKIYGWVEDGILYWWSKADFAVLPANLSYYFYNETSLKSIDWTGIFKDGYWKGSVGSEKITESITNMRIMFYNCSSIENLDISWFNNSKITTEENMKYAFGNYSSATVTGIMSSLKYIKIGQHFKLFESSILKNTSWKEQSTGKEYQNTSLIGELEPGTYEYMGVKVKYAVQIYGIQQDCGSNDEKLGLTFGPATGGNYNNSYVTHDYKEVDDNEFNVVIITHTINSDGSETTSEKTLKNSRGENVTRTLEEKTKYNINIHKMTWKEISEQSKKDPTVFKDAILCGDTKSVEINLNSSLSNGTTQKAYGDGAGILKSTINDEYKKWNYQNRSAENVGGYASSRIRATLVGSDSNTYIDYAGTDVLNSENCLFSCIEDDLQQVIAKKEVKCLSTKTGKQDIITVSDSLWIFSMAEACMTTGTGYNLEGTAKTGPMSYDKFDNEESNSFFNSTTAKKNSRVACYENGSSWSWWLRSPYESSTACAVNYQGQGGASYANGTSVGLAFGFCIK